MLSHAENKSLLSEDAFIPVSAPKIEDKLFKQLYPDEKVIEYAKSIRGSIKPTDPDFTPEELEILNRFNTQFNILMAELKKHCDRLGVEYIEETMANEPDLEIKEEKRYRDKIKKFTAHFCSRKDIDGQTTEFYFTIKEAFENIIINLSHNSSLSDKSKTNILKTLLKEFATCDSGIFNLIKATKEALSSHETVEAWIAQLRKLIITQIAADYWCNHKTFLGRVHVENAFLLYAHQKGWHPYDYTPVLNDQFANVAPEAYEFLEKDFLERFTPFAIMDNIIDRLTSLIYDKFKKEKEKEKRLSTTTIIVRDQVEQKELFFGIPIASDPNIGPFYLFDVQEDKESEEKSNQQPTFSLIDKHGTNHFILKSRDGLMHSLLKPLSRTEGQKIFNYVKDSHFSFLPNTFGFKHSDSEPDELIGVTPFDDVKKSNFPICSELFQLYRKSGETDFSKCILDGDFSECETLKDVIFTETKLINVTITPIQYLNYFHRRGAIFEKINGTLITAEMMQNSSNQEKGVLLFYASITRQKKFIPALIQAGAQISTSKNREIDLALAERLSKPDCIDAITAKVARTQELKDFYGLILYHAAKNDDLTVVNALLDAGVSQGKIAITFAAAKGNRTLVQILAEKMDRNNPKHQKHLVKALIIFLNAKKINFCLWLINHIEMDLNFRVSMPYKDTDGIVNNTTIMHHAARLGHTEVIRALLAKGADVFISDTKYYTPLDYAISCRKWTVVDVIMDNLGGSFCLTNGYSAGSSLSAMILHKQVGLAEKYIDLYGKNILTFQYAFEIDNEFFHFTPLHCAAYVGSLPLINKLLALGADINRRTGLNKTAAEVAAQKGHWICVDRLVNHDKTNNSSKRAIREAASQELIREQVADENKFQNLDNESLDVTTKALFKNLEKALNAHGNETQAKRIIFDHFNPILRGENQVNQNPVDIHKAIYASQEKLITKLSNTPSRLTTHVLEKLAALFFLAGVFCAGGLVGTLVSQGLTSMACLVPILAPICLLALVGCFSVSIYSMFRTNRYTEKADEANALQPLTNLFFHVSRK